MRVQVSAVRAKAPKINSSSVIPPHSVGNLCLASNKIHAVFPTRPFPFRKLNSPLSNQKTIPSKPASEPSMRLVDEPYRERRSEHRKERKRGPI
jgi:hypothetical protein